MPTSYSKDEFSACSITSSSIQNSINSVDWTLVNKCPFVSSYYSDYFFSCNFSNVSCFFLIIEAISILLDGVCTTVGFSFSTSIWKGWISGK